MKELSKIVSLFSLYLNLCEATMISLTPPIFVIELEHFDLQHFAGENQCIVNIFYGTSLIRPSFTFFGPE